MIPSWRLDKRTAQERGYTYAWKKERDLYLLENPLCVMCIELDCVIEPANVVDHIKPHKGDPLLFWDKRNWQAICTNHHSSHKQRLERSGIVQRGIGVDGWPLEPSGGDQEVKTRTLKNQTLPLIFLNSDKAQNRS